MSEAVVLSVGEDYRVAGVLQGRIAYAGMPSESVFSLAVKKEAGGSYAWNLFFPTYEHDIAVAGNRILIESVTPHSIKFRVQQGFPAQSPVQSSSV
jgi:hypothetical protein